jgi:hypothetical protein
MKLTPAASYFPCRVGMAHLFLEKWHRPLAYAHRLKACATVIIGVVGLNEGGGMGSSL